MFDFLDNAWKGIGNFGADADQFMKREMPFDSGWGAPAAAVAAYFGGPAVMSAFGEGAAGAGGGALDSIGGGGTFGGANFGIDSAGSYMPTGGGNAGDIFSGWSPTGSAANGAGDNFVTSDPNSFADGYSSSGFKNPNAAANLNKPSFQQLLGKQLMSGGMGGGSKQGYQYQEQPVQRQGAFLPVAQAPALQDKQSEIAALIAALRSKGTI